jgi:D-aminoacyl-tRNA deacylase
MRIALVCSTKDSGSVNITSSLKQIVDFERNPREERAGLQLFESGEGLVLIETDVLHLYAEFLDEYCKNIGVDLIVFLSEHASEKGVASFTVHPEGNWSEEARFGGRPKQLSFASPVYMLKVLAALKARNDTALSVTYEATHHGPLLRTPSFFVEIGGDEATIVNRRYGRIVAESVMEALGSGYEVQYGKVALGIGSSHYPEKFSALALEGVYAFAHIMPKYYVSEVDMLQQAIKRSVPEVEVAAIEWKSIKSNEREGIIRGLDQLGIDHERV